MVLPNMDWTGDAGYIPHVALGALAAGGVARLGKGLIDLYREGGDDDSRYPVKAIRPAQAMIPVEVSTDEARELRKRGVKVRHVLAKRAAEAPPKTNPSFVNALLYGGLGAGAAVGGWKLIDYAMDAQRKSEAKARLDAVRKRIEKMLNNDPYAQDVGVYESMKTGAARLLKGDDLVKEAGLADLFAIGGLLVGGGATLAGISGYQKGIASSPSRAKAKALQRLLASSPTAVPRATMTPYVLTDPTLLEDEEDEDKQVAAVPALPAPKPTFVQVSKPSGSPARQAAATGAQAPVAVML
jgi:hypothetical protein